MITTRILGAVAATLVASSLGAVAACGGTSESAEVSTAKAVSTASVTIALMDANGNRVGQGSGVMIAPRLVLTSGHMVAGNAKWVVTSADGKVKANGSRGLTYDWMRYDSSKAHPRKHDVGIIYLDDSINLSSYPNVVGAKAAPGASATRIRSNGAAFEALDVSLGGLKNHPHSYLADFPASESLDTGGAVFDSHGIIGVVSGKGMKSSKLYIARTDGLAKWLAPKIVCAGGASGTRTYAAAEPKEQICDDAGVPITDSTSTPDNSSANPNSPGSKSPGDTCKDDDQGFCSGNSCGSHSGQGPNGGGPDGSQNPGSNHPGNPGGTPGAPGGTPTDATSPDSSTGDANHPGSSSGSNPSTSWNPSGPNSGTAVASSSSSGGPGGPNAGGPGGPGGPSGTPDEVCSGPNDNPETCPTELDGCSGNACGGGDEDVDWGFCGCGASGSYNDGIK